MKVRSRYSKWKQVLRDSSDSREETSICITDSVAPRKGLGVWLLLPGFGKS